MGRKKIYIVEDETTKESKAPFLYVNGEKSDRLSHGRDNSVRPLSTAPGKGEAGREGSEHDDIRCGCGPFSPSALQACMTIGWFTAFYSASGIVISALSVYLNSQITTLEKQFNFSSTTSGFLMSCNDLGYVLTTLLMSYYTRRVHIPRALGLATVMFGMSGLVCSLAFFVTRRELEGPPDSGSGGDVQLATPQQTFFAQMCDMTNSKSSGNTTGDDLSHRTLENNEIPESLKWVALCIIASGMVGQGMAKSPRQPFVGTYVDDNVAKTKSTFYLGIIGGLSILGPAMAYVLGGVFSRFYVTLEETDMSERDPRWIGAWWLGFIVFGTMGIVSAFPLFFFPGRLRGRRNVEESQRVEPAAGDGTKIQSVANDLKGFFKSLRRLLTNPVYTLIVLSSGTNFMAIAGFMAFMPKYLETQFTMPVFQANVVLGSVNVVSASLGTVLGGFLTMRFKLSPRACLRFILAGMIVSTLVLCLGFFLGCDQPFIETGDSSPSDENPYISQCVGDCNCDSENFFPVCGSDNRNYFSPCHAGCTDLEGSHTFLHCSCIGLPSNQTGMPTAAATTAAFPVVNSSSSSSAAAALNSQKATAGLCPSSCNNFVPYVIAIFFMAFIATMTGMPIFVVYVRSVLEKDKPLAMGFMAFCGTLIGWFPGPVLFGRIVDTTCVIWKGGDGACSLYDLPSFRLRYIGATITLRIVSLLLIIVVCLIVSFSKTFEFQSHDDEMAVAAPKEKETVREREEDDGAGGGESKDSPGKSYGSFVG